MKSIFNLSLPERKSSFIKWALLDSPEEGYVGDGIYLSRFIEPAVADFLTKLIDFDKLNQKSTTNEDAKQDIEAIQEMLIDFINEHPSEEDAEATDTFVDFWEYFAGPGIKEEFDDKTLKEFHDYLYNYKPIIQDLPDYIGIDVSPAEPDPDPPEDLLNY